MRLWLLRALLGACAFAATLGPAYAQSLGVEMGRVAPNDAVEVRGGEASRLDDAPPPARREASRRDANEPAPLSGVVIGGRVVDRSGLDAVQPTARRGRRSRTASRCESSAAENRAPSELTRTSEERARGEKMNECTQE